MSTTNRISTYVVAGIAAMDVPLPFAGYEKPSDQWVDPAVPEHYTLNEIDGTELTGRLVKIRKSLDGQFFIYADPDFSYRLGQFQLIEQLGQALGVPVYILSTQEELQLEMSGQAGDLQISTWEEAIDGG